MNTNLSQLYASYRESLSNDTLVMQDDILRILIQMEASITDLVPSVIIDPRRQERYKKLYGESQFHSHIAREVSVIIQEIGKNLSIQHMLGQIQRRQSQVRELLSHESYESICQKLGITYRLHTDGETRPFVPTDKRESPITTGSGNGYESRERAPKFLEFLTLLQDIETPEGGYIDTRDLIIDLQTETPENMMRTLPYIVIRIPRLSRTILIDDRIGEGTYVFDRLIDLDIIQTQTKSEYKSGYGARLIRYDQNYRSNLMEVLLYDVFPANENDTSGNIGENMKQRPIAPRMKTSIASLFLDSARIRQDLEGFREKGGIPTLLELTSTNPKLNTKITLSNYQEMTWSSYLINASNHLLGTKQGEKNNGPRPGEALEKIKEIIRLISINKEYFTNPTYVQQDLENFFTKSIDISSLTELSSTNPKPNTKITLSNGQEMSYQRYLTNASNHLLGTKQGEKNNGPRPGEALEKIKDSIGLIIIDKKYFENSKYVGIDLDEFRKKAGLSSIAELSSANPKQSKTSTLSNGQKMTWGSYLRYARNALIGTKFREDGDTPKRGEALKLLKKIAISDKNEV